MATDTALHRRQVLRALVACALPGLPAWAATGAQTRRLVAGWEEDHQAFVGVLDRSAGGWTPGARLALPTRPHGLEVEPDGSVLVVARRPGDWLLRWHPATGAAQWSWQDSDRRLNGHVVPTSSGQWLLSTETDRGTGEGWLGVRDRHSLRVLDAWPTAGIDPHQLLVLPQALGPWPAGTVVVANGGVRTRAETGRTPSREQPLDASLVALHPDTGRLLGQWRLDDPWLSVRHLAWDARSGRLGVALQAEHPDEGTRRAAPVLATWDGQSLRVGSGGEAGGGYGGDIVAAPVTPAGGFVVSCTTAGRLACFDPAGRWVRSEPLPQACALAAEGSTVWGGGQGQLLGLSPAGDDALPLPTGLTLDNHARRLA